MERSLPLQLSLYSAKQCGDRRKGNAHLLVASLGPRSYSRWNLFSLCMLPLDSVVPGRSELWVSSSSLSSGTQTKAHKMLRQIRWGPYSHHIEMTFCFSEGWQAQQCKLMTPGGILAVVVHGQNCLWSFRSLYLIPWSIAILSISSSGGLSRMQNLSLLHS